MSDTTDLHGFYEGELYFIRRLYMEFAQRYPNTAGRLLLEPNRSKDPHVERLIEAFALLSARVQLKLHDEFPELTDALLGVLYPHYLAPVPSMAVVQFDPDPNQPLPPTGHLIKAGSPLLAPLVGGVRCHYRTAYPVHLWPVTITEARIEQPPFSPGLTGPPPANARAALRLTVETPQDLPFAMLQLDKIRLHLHGDGVAYPLYDLLLNHAIQVVIRPFVAGSPPVVMDAKDCLTPVGFAADEGLLPYPPQSFLGYRLLTEFFAFPAKFLFVDLGGWARTRTPAFGRKVEVVVFLNRAGGRVEQVVDAASFRQGCSPAVNLFEVTAEPIDLKQTKPEYRVLPDVTKREAMEVYSIEEVTGAQPDGRDRRFRPFYSFQHGEADAGEAFWYSSRRPSLLKDDAGTEVFLSLVDRHFDAARPAETVLVVKCLCTNRDLPQKLPHDGTEIRLDVTFSAPVGKVKFLAAPTPTLRRPGRRGAHWRLVSHLSLNHLSLETKADGLAALKEILSLYDYTDREVESHAAAVVRQQIEGLTDMRSRPTVGCIGPPGRGGFCRGVEVTLEFDETKFVGLSMFLFASVLERFLALYVTLNSFTQSVARTKQGTGELRRWPPRAGEQPLL